MLLPAQEAHPVVRTARSAIFLLVIDPAGIDYTGY